MSDLDKLHRQLERANTVAGFKALHDDAAALAKEAATARDFSLLDDCTAVRLACTRSGGILMLGGAERVPGVDDQVWERRAAMAEAQFAGAVARADRRPGTGRVLPRLLHMLHENRTTVLKAKL